MRFSVPLLTLLSVSLANAKVCPPASFYPSFNGNVSISDSAYYSFRTASAFSFSLPALGGLGWYSSFASSGSASPSGGQVQVDALAARTSADSLTPPTASFAWFDTQANYNLNINNQSISGNTGAGFYSSAMSTIFLDLVEFYDANNNGQFDLSTDPVVQTIYLSQQTWDNMCQSSATPNSPDSNIVSFNITTLKPLFPNPLRPYVNFGLQTTLSQVVGVLNNGNVITPRSMKIDLMINDFPYKGYNNNNDGNTKNTKLAIGVVVASALANASVAAGFNVNSNIIQTNGNNQESSLSFSWDARASVNSVVSGSGNINVAASGFGSFSNLAQIGNAAEIFFSAYANAAVDFKQVYFTFDSIQPSSIYWDPVITSGPLVSVNNDSSQLNSVALGLGIFFGLVGLVLAVYLAFKVRSHFAKNKLNETQPLVEGNNYARVNEI